MIICLELMSMSSPPSPTPQHQRQPERKQQNLRQSSSIDINSLCMIYINFLTFKFCGRLPKVMQLKKKAKCILPSTKSAHNSTLIGEHLRLIFW